MDLARKGNSLIGAAMNELALTAQDINAEYELARTSIVDSANRILNVGRMLADVKQSLPHGKFIPWIEANCIFQQRAARLMMSGFRKWQSTAVLNEEDALQISRQAWGNCRPPPSNASESSADEPSGVVDAQDVTGTQREPTIDDDELRTLHEAAELFDGLSRPGVSLHARFGNKLRQGKLPAMFELCSEAHADMQAAAARKSLITIRLRDNTHYQIPVQFIEDLKDEFPNLDVDRALSDCAAWHGMNPDSRKAEGDIKSHILLGIKNCDDGVSMWQ